MRTCGDCTYCCKVMAVTELAKPAGQWCQHCTVGTGCQIYADRPEGCRAFECFWLQSGNFPEGSKMYRMPEEMRPDRVKAVFSGTRNGHIVMLYVDPAAPEQWRQNAPVARTVEMLRQKFNVVIVCGAHRTMLAAYSAEGRAEAERLISIR